MLVALKTDCFFIPKHLFNKRASLFLFLFSSRKDLKTSLYLQKLSLKPVPSGWYNEEENLAYVVFN